MNEVPVKIIHFGPNLSVIQPTTGDSKPPSNLPIEAATEVVTRLKPSSEDIGMNRDEILLVSEYKIKITVKEIKGKCSVHKVGDSAEVVGDKICGDLCLMALHTIFPYLFAMQYGAEFPFKYSSEDVTTVPCPDPDNLTFFEIRRVKL